MSSVDFQKFVYRAGEGLAHSCHVFHGEVILTDLSLDYTFASSPGVSLSGFENLIYLVLGVFGSYKHPF